MLELSKPLIELTRVMQTSIASPCRRAVDGSPLFLSGLSLTQW
jgi:hypothetical protein